MELGGPFSHVTSNVSGAAVLQQMRSAPRYWLEQQAAPQVEHRSTHRRATTTHIYACMSVQSTSSHTHAPNSVVWSQRR